MTNEDKNGFMGFIFLLALFLLALSFITGCYSDNNLGSMNPKKKLFIIQKDDKQCVAAEISDNYIDRYGDAQPNYRGFITIRCGFTPNQATDYLNHVQNSIDYFTSGK